MRIEWRSAARPWAAGVLVVGLGLPAVATGSGPLDPEDRAMARLQQDAGRPLTLRAEDDGDVSFVGVPARGEVDHPGVTPSTSPAAAADAAIARYGAAFGTRQPGTTVERVSVRPAVTGDVVRYRQEVQGVPVLGGDLVVTLRPDGELASLLARTTDATTVAAPGLTQAEAEEQAVAAFHKVAGAGEGTQVSAEGRWLLDPALVGGDAGPVRTAWRFEITRGVAERRLVMVDDRTGAVLLNAGLIAAINRVVCDDADVPRDEDLAPPACIGPAYARSEGGLPAGEPDVDSAYDLAAPVSDLYAVLGTDLTALIGRTVSGGGRALAQTVNFCPTSTPLPPACPGYENAFWNGEQMYYGDGFAVADDVVGHEMTHGVTERTSGLFYWGQSGAINESISDIIGEIVDHRSGPVGEPVTWEMGEDLPGGDALRDLADPTAVGDPDRTSSPHYRREDCSSSSCYDDNDGVHSNSGVGNKTFYLISQGGSFNGQTVAGIDAGDAGLTKSARLWLLVDQSLASGSDYADLAAVLDQSCQSLVASSAPGFTAADCAAVHAATLATELRLTPATNPQPADAVDACLPGTTKRVLLDSEAGPLAAFNAGPTWSRAGVPGWGQVAHSAPDAWASAGPPTTTASSLVAVGAVEVPAGQATYLRFQQWRVLDHFTDSPGVVDFYDGGAVEIDDLTDGTRDGTSQLPWTANGPADVLAPGAPIPAPRIAFGGDSRGYLASQVDLSPYAGHTIRPVFTIYTDSSVAFVGWFVDDIQLYTCDLPPPAPPATTPPPPTLPPTLPPTSPPPPVPAVIQPGQPRVVGTARVGRVLTARPGTWQPAGVSLRHRWLRNGKAIGKATKAKYQLVRADRGKRISVRITGTKAGYAMVSVTSKATVKVRPRLVR